VITWQDKGARRFLKMLDDDLKGCKFDVVDTKASFISTTGTIFS